MSESDDDDQPLESFSHLKRQRARSKLHDALAIAPDEKFLQLLWGVHAVQSGRERQATRALSFPAEAVDSDPGSKFAIHAWELETLANQLLLAPKRPGRRFYPCDTFSTAAEFINYLRRIDDTEFGMVRDDVDIFNELHRIGHRQFPWQRPPANLPDFYRPLFLYGQGAAADYFAERHGLAVADFAKIGFALYGQYLQRPVLTGLPDYSVLGIEAPQLEAALRLVSLDRAAARSELLKLLQLTGSRRWPTAYQPSVLRRHPLLIYDGDRRWAPLPALVLQRVTFGLYYDLLQPGGGLRDEIGKRFEQYCADYLAAQMPGFGVSREYRYTVPGRGGGHNSPDILVQVQGELALIIECKATKLTFAAQFSDDPATDAEARYAEIGRGVFQVWRFVSHCRRRLTKHTVGPATRGMVLTLDTWMVMSRGLQDHVLSVASRLADAHPDILPEDRCGVVFAACQDFELLASQTSEDAFLETIDSANEERFLGWLLPNIRKEVAGATNLRKPYPFDPGDLLPWWGQFRRLSGH